MSYSSFLPNTASRQPGIPATPRISRREGPLSPAVFATLVLVVTELMFFVALLSAYHVVKSRSFGAWLPIDNVKLPIAVTIVNTLILLASGVSLILCEANYRTPERRQKAYKLFTQALVLGGVFVGVQGYEWIRLLGAGFDVQSGLFGSTFYLIIGSHGLHAFAALLIMAAYWTKVRRGEATLPQIRAMTIFWLFVVSVWPVLFGTVYFP